MAYSDLQLEVVNDLGNSLPVSGTVTVNQGSPTTGDNAWPTTITDISNTIVKPGDTTYNAIKVNVVAGDVGFVPYLRQLVENMLISIRNQEDLAVQSLDTVIRTTRSLKKALAAGTSSVSSSSTSSVMLLDINLERVGASIYNDSTSNLYIKLGSAASATDFTVLLVSGAYYELPYGYLGTIEGIWSSTNGSARMTEFV
jgi:hypothetical protein